MAINGGAGGAIDQGAHSDDGRPVRQAPTSRRLSLCWQHGLAAAWIVLLTAAVLTPALARGSMIGTYDLINSSGLTSRAGVVVHGSYTSRDIIGQMIPWTVLNWTQVHHGMLPLWNPYNGLGLPLAFNWQSASFGLPSLVGYLLPLRLAVTAGVVVTLLVAGSGAYVLGRILRLGLVGSLMAATVFELSGPLISWLGFPHAQVMSWGGWLFVAGIMVVREGRRASSVAFLAVVTALAIYAGHPETLIIMEVALGVFLLALLVSRALPARFGLGSGPIRRPTVDLAVGTAVGCALGAPLLLPALQLTSLSVRAGSTSLAPPPVHDLLYTVFSGFDGMSVAGNFGFDGSFFYAETAAYVGSIAVALAIVGAVVAVWRRRVEWLAISLVVIVMGALAYWSPAIHLAERIPKVGTINWFRALMPLSLGVAVLAGVGVDAVAGSARAPTVRKWLVGVFGVGAMLMALLWLFGRNGGLPEFNRPFEMHVRAESFFWPGVGVTVGLVGALLLLWRPATGRLVAVLLLAVESIFLVTSGAVQFGSSAEGIVATPAVHAVKNTVGSAVVGFGTGPLAAQCALGVVPEVNGALQLHELELYDPIVPKSYFTTWRQETGSNGGNTELNLFCPSIRTVADAQRVGVQYVLEPTGTAGPSGSVFVKTIKVADLGPDQTLKPPPDEDLYRIPDGASVTLTARDGAGSGPASSGTAGPVAVDDSDPANRTIITNSHTAGVLRLHLTDVPGWSATIDGRRLTLEHASVFLLRADIPPGRHVIELHYWPSTLSAGIAIAVVAFLFLVGWMVLERRGRLRRPAPGTEHQAPVAE